MGRGRALLAADHGLEQKRHTSEPLPGQPDLERLRRQAEELLRPLRTCLKPRIASDQASLRIWMRIMARRTKASALAVEVS